MRETAIDAGEFHVHAAEWLPEEITFFVDGDSIKTVDQSPAYSMQLMLSIYEFRPAANDAAGAYPKEFVVDYVRAYRFTS